MINKLYSNHVNPTVQKRLVIEMYNWFTNIDKFIK